MLTMLFVSFLFPYRNIHPPTPNEVGKSRKSSILPWPQSQMVPVNQCPITLGSNNQNKKPLTSLFPPHYNDDVRNYDREPLTLWFSKWYPTVSQNIFCFNKIYWPPHFPSFAIKTSSCTFPHQKLLKETFFSTMYFTTVSWNIWWLLFCYD